MDIGDFDHERMNSERQRYIKQINPLLNNKTFTKESYRLYNIAHKLLHEPHFNCDTQELKDIYKNALLYFRGDERSKYDPCKGLFVHGDTGCGKSIFFEVFKEYTMQLKTNSFVKSKQLKIVADIAQNGICNLENYIKEREPIVLYIDDFGSGNSIINHYGTTYDVMDELIQGRYDEFVKSGAITHISTNIKPSEFKDKFNERITSRLNAMFNVIDFPVKDYRRVKF